jgi:hypothetical protein
MQMTPEQFWTHVDIQGPNDCWYWTGGHGTKGYGSLMLVDSKEQRAHRVAYMLTHGDIHAGMHILHSCHNPGCCNPAHLRAGTNQENMDDRAAAGRTACGEKMPRAKLTTEEVCCILTAYLAGHRIVDLAHKYSLTHQGLQNIIYGKTWKHITGGINRRLHRSTPPK